jgi:hypothetical protein
MVPNCFDGRGRFVRPSPETIAEWPESAVAALDALDAACKHESEIQQKISEANAAVVECVKRLAVARAARPAAPTRIEEARRNFAQNRRA